MNISKVNDLAYIVLKKKNPFLIQHERMDINEISVVIPCYNAKETIEKCIESVYAQTYSVKELITIDDGSKDNTVEILRRLKEKYESHPIEFHILTQVNSGPSAARNKGIKFAKSFWIAFLDADDYWTPQKLEKQIEFLAYHKDVVLCASANLKKSIPFISPSFEQMLYRNFFTTPTVLSQKNILLEIPFNEKQYFMEDQLLWLQIAKKYKIIVLNGNYALQIEKKAVFGEKGLSSNLWEMEKAELSNYKKLLQLNYLTFPHYCLLILFSFTKFIRRILISGYRKLKTPQRK